MSNFFKICMLIISFLPLWVSILFVDIISIFYMKSNNITTEFISIFIILIINILSLFIVRVDKVNNKKVKERIKVYDVKTENKLTIEYLLSYVLPLIAFDFTLWYDCVKFLIYFFLISFLCIKNNIVYNNIWLEIKGYKIYSCKAKANKDIKDIYLISKDDLVIRFNNYKTLNLDDNREVLSLDVIEYNKPYYFNSENNDK